MHLSLALWVAFSFVIAYLGRRTRIGYWGMFFCSLLFSPLIAAIGLFLSTERRRRS